MAKQKGRELTVITNVSNGAQDAILSGQPYRATVQIVGTMPLLMHCWNIEAISGKANAQKGSAEKKTDNLESYVLRDDDGFIVMPTINFCASIREAGRKFPDPTSPRKSMRDLLKAIVVPETENALINDGVKVWDAVDQRRVVIQRAGITRSRPMFNTGWTMTFDVMVLEPAYLDRELLFKLIESAGKFQAIGDFRPTYGRFRVGKFDISEI